MVLDLDLFSKTQSLNPTIVMVFFFLSETKWNLSLYGYGVAPYFGAL